MKFLEGKKTVCNSLSTMENSVSCKTVRLRVVLCVHERLRSDKECTVNTV